MSALETERRAADAYNMLQSLIDLRPKWSIWMIGQGEAF